MKELSIEEKARAYDEVLNKLRHFLTKGVDPLITRADVQDFFPELAESEGEKVRKEIVRFIRMEVEDEIVGNKWIAWLERQGQVKESAISQHENRTCEENDDSLTSEDERIRKWCISHFKGCINVIKDNDEYKEYLSNKVLAWLERQGEHANFRNKIQVGDKVTRNEAGMLVNLSQLKRVAKPSEKQCEQKLEMKTAEESLSIDSDTYNKIVDECIFGEKKPEENKGNIGGFSAEWSENDKAFLDDILCKLEHDLILNKDEKDWLKSLRPQPKQEWSDEDEVKINRIVACLENLNVADNDILLKDVDWLKSLRPQPKQSLDEDTQQWIDTIIKDYEDLYNTDKDHGATIQAKISILKSLRPQNTWKPSDEQMGLLQAIINEPNNAASESCQIVLKDILEQLRKLKE